MVCGSHQASTGGLTTRHDLANTCTVTRGQIFQEDAQYGCDKVQYGALMLIDHVTQVGRVAMPIRTCHDDRSAC